MLKMKDNFNLENLRNYGFEHLSGSSSFLYPVKYDYWEFCFDNESTTYTVMTKTKELYIDSDSEYITIDLLYDMIIDGIVEKVED